MSGSRLKASLLCCTPMIALQRWVGGLLCSCNVLFAVICVWFFVWFVPITACQLSSKISLVIQGKELRLKQQYFFVSASIQDVMSRFKATHGTKFEMLPEKAAFQMNDTHPTIAVAELMRLLVDVEGLEWEAAWNITSKVLP
jgi:Carbohydrate phosphorylase